MPVVRCLAMGAGVSVEVTNDGLVDSGVNLTVEDACTLSGQYAWMRKENYLYSQHGCYLRARNFYDYYYYLYYYYHCI